MKNVNINFKKHPVILFDHHLTEEDHSGHCTRCLITNLEENGLAIIHTNTAKDALDSLAYTVPASAFVFDWDSLDQKRRHETLSNFLQHANALNETIPIFVLTQQHEIDDSDYPALKHVDGYFWKYADNINFVAGRIKFFANEYIESLYPPFFKALVEYCQENKYAWHTPGHMGGVAFLKSPIGYLFHEFFGENTFRSDLSISVPELGSLMEHSGVNGTAEQLAAETFGSDLTFFVTNGTSTSNKVVMMGTATQGDIAIIDRNCHKSLQHALTMANVVPIYFVPTRNHYGIIGGIPESEFRAETIRQKIQDCPLASDKTNIPKIAVVTNSTYDGLIYNVNKIKDLMGEANIPVLHFDEAWYPYANFHPIYEGKFGMSEYHKADYHPTVFSTQSTHKLLAAFSQASMVHLKEGNYKINPDLLNETFMMHTSTSPQYSIIASLDISTKMMSGQFGYRLISESISEAIAFRLEFKKIKREVGHKSWFFDIWQPDEVNKIKPKQITHYMHFAAQDDQTWMLQPKDSWHGFADVDKDHMMLDPIKVSIITPGINVDGSTQEFGVPAPIVSRALMHSGVVDEKTGFYTMLFLFSIGVNKSKAMTLLTDLVRFKNKLDSGTMLCDFFPELTEQYAERYLHLSLAELAAEMHRFLSEHDSARILMQAFEVLPDQIMTPNQAYQHIVRGEVEEVLLDGLIDRTILTMVAPYPPGIPVVMPGEKLTQRTKIIIDYLKLLEDFDNAFPGFENEVHGAEVKIIDGKHRYAINCRLE